MTLIAFLIYHRFYGFTQAVAQSRGYVYVCVGEEGRVVMCIYVCVCGGGGYVCRKYFGRQFVQNGHT